MDATATRAIHSDGYTTCDSQPTLRFSVRPAAKSPSMSTSDPFESYPQNPYSLQETASAQIPQDMQRGLVHHVAALGILTIVQGALVTLMGLFLIGMAAVVPAMIKAQGGFPNQPGMPQRPMPAEMEWVLLAVYGGAGVIAVALGVLNIVGGIGVMRFRGRILGIVALSSGLLSIFGCYCFPTALGLFIYGLIVLLNGPVKRAFEMGTEGVSSTEIQAHFARLPVA